MVSRERGLVSRAKSFGFNERVDKLMAEAN